MVLSHTQGFGHFPRIPEGAFPFLLAILCSWTFITLTPQLVPVYGLVAICSCSRVLRSQVRWALTNADSCSGNRKFNGGEEKQHRWGPRWFREPPPPQHQHLFGLGFSAASCPNAPPRIQGSDRMAVWRRLASLRRRHLVWGQPARGLRGGRRLELPSSSWRPVLSPAVDCAHHSQALRFHHFMK